MDISGLSKAKVLAALFNASKLLGRGALNPKAMEPMTDKEAEEILASGQTYFEYLNGKVMKIDLSEDDLDTWLYNRDNGSEVAERVIAGLRA